jgi:hypothetical protein
MFCDEDDRACGGYGGCSKHNYNDGNDDSSRNSNNINQRTGIDKEHLYYTLKISDLWVV